MKPAMPGLPIGIYEKALPTKVEWARRLEMAAEAGYDFIEISLDPSAERLGRLEWPAAYRRQIRRASEDLGLPILTLCLSAHRHFPLGSTSATVREQGLEIMRRAIDLAYDLGVRIVQVAGYDTEEGASNPISREFYIEGVRQAVAWASGSLMTLGLENQEVGFVDSPSRAVQVIRIVDSPHLHLYMDLGNLVVNGRAVADEIAAARGHLVGIHIKDARPGEPRRVPLGKGMVPFAQAFAQLARMDYHGPMMIEMWNDDCEDAIEICKEAKRWLDRQLEEAWRTPLAVAD